MRKATRATACVYVAAFILGGLLAGSVAWADGGAKHKVRNTHFGVSGGNIKDISRAFCCGGTAGSLLVDSSNVLHVLSNNHVFARSGSASLLEDIIQPGLIDVGCRGGNATVIGDLSPSPPLGSNVDAAIAALRSGTMDTTGFIEDIGTINNVPRTPELGLPVAKSGRTSGYNESTITALNASVSIQYQRGCNSGKKFTVTYTGQIITGSMAVGGDSGSLLVTKDNCRQPVGLLFAGSSSYTIHNPIDEVLTKVGAALTKSVSFVGDPKVGCTPYTASSAGSSSRGPSRNLVDFATSVMQEHMPQLMRGPVIGVGVGAADETPAEAVIVAFIDRTQGAAPELPQQVRGVRIKRVLTDPFIALPGSKSCGNPEGAGASN